MIDLSDAAYADGYRDGAEDYEAKNCPLCKRVSELQDKLMEAYGENHRLQTELDAERDLVEKLDRALENAQDQLLYLMG